LKVEGSISLLHNKLRIPVSLIKWIMDQTGRRAESTSRSIIDGEAG
jgi:hypothetical protein